MAWAEKRRDGWRACYRDSAAVIKCVKDTNGHIIIYDRKPEAVRAGSVAEDKARRQAPIATSKTASQTWGEWWDRTGGNRHPNSDYDDREKSMVKVHVRPRWGKVKLNQILTKDVQEWVNELSANNSANYTQHIYFTLRSSLRDAVNAEPPVLAANPCNNRIKLPTVHRRQDKRFTSNAVLDRYREAGLRDDYLAWLAFQHETGMRPGEVSGLHVKWIEESRDYLTVADTFVAGKKRAIKPNPKNGKYRKIYLTPEANAILDNQLKDRDLRQGCGLPHLDGKPCTSDLVFRRHRTGDVIIPKDVNTTLDRVEERAGLPSVTPYAGRRGFATWAHGAGLTLSNLQGQLGHATEQETRAYIQDLITQGRDELRAARRKANDQ